MALKLMYITNKPEIARIAENAGVDRIFVDMEYIGKAARQGGMDTVQNHHTLKDVRIIKTAVQRAEVMCRVNLIHDACEEYGSSQAEIDGAIAAGADTLMLPFFKSAEEVRQFISLVNGRAKTLLLLETPEAAAAVDEILSVPGIDGVHIGLNDLSLGYGMKFMFELLADGTVEKLCGKFAEKGIPYGFGGIASPGKGMLPSEYIIREHYRLGSTCAILGRSFCNTNSVTDLEEVQKVFESGLEKIRKLEAECQSFDRSSDYFRENTREVVRRVKMIVGG